MKKNTVLENENAFFLFHPITIREENIKNQSKTLSQKLKLVL